MPEGDFLKYSKQQARLAKKEMGSKKKSHLNIWIQTVSSRPAFKSSISNLIISNHQCLQHAGCIEAIVSATVKKGREQGLQGGKCEWGFSSAEGPHSLEGVCGCK